MARDRGPPALRPPGAAALPAEPRGWGWLGAGLWPALLVGLLAAIVAWFWYGDGDRRAEEGGEEAAAGGEGPRRTSAAATEDAAAGGGPVRREVAAAAPSGPSKPGEDRAAVSREELNHVPSGAVSGEAVELERLIPEHGVTDSGEHPAAMAGSQAGEPGAQVGQASDGWCVMNLAGASDDDCKERNEERPCQPAERRDLDHEEWEVVSEHLVEGKDGSMEDSDSKEWEQGDCCDGDSKAKRVAAVPPMFQNIHVAFRVHYITHSDAQVIGVTGDHECLGQWHSYVPSSATRMASGPNPSVCP
ncbi:hypothetical protein DUI87_08684 [Hirundo rustica rustica]|uniref:CBM20 domain-containing protein n=1 Tax=Hirundo rustica rustica TaxID=333673 RepID=A0A3M0KK32_HIRRU|nr:hypothetical protein DUI87_08684 [Hirundo rustica rustica]